ncbi:MAG: hypothetical protein M1355_03465 [Patescibacteria group bacterium]|nr:hypothetical protein [Patescibacteria group bacterium]
MSRKKKKFIVKHNFIHKKDRVKKILTGEAKDSSQKTELLADDSLPIKKDFRIFLFISLGILLIISILYLIWTKTGLFNPFLSRFGI